MPSNSSLSTSAASNPQTRHKIVVCTDLGPALPLLRDRRDIDVVTWTENRCCDRNWMLQNIVGASGVVVCFQNAVDRELVETAGPNLRVVSTISVGYEHIDLNVLAQHNIRVGYTPDILTDAVADSAVMLALMASRRAGHSYAFVKNNEWPTFHWTPFAFCGPQLSTTTFSPTPPCGLWNHTLHLHPPAPAPSRNPHATNNSAPLTGSYPSRPSTSPALARDSDVLFVLAPGGPTTRHLVDEAFLRLMKPTSVLVNNGRGSVVDSTALARALAEGWIWGAGLDVVEEEPHVGPEHPLVGEPRCVVLPHIGSAALETRAEMATLTARNALAGVLGQPLPVALDYSTLV
ncbi:Glyoxylate reductase [Mycena sanguinolenta]|uniref:Glyoxylate reductase n=1 Tax=Mycena sanguinolenta TaxID=230812 RepID=A0A8H6ZB64_9AGAR|nr:Glyoxylate reductase [Mycena sanguinolenta]